MVREFAEEAGIATAPSDWEAVIRVVADKWEIDVFRMVIDIDWPFEPVATEEGTVSVYQLPPLLRPLDQHGELDKTAAWLARLCQDTSIELLGGTVRVQ